MNITCISYLHLDVAPPSDEVIRGDREPLPLFPPKQVLTVRDGGVHAGVVRGRESPHFLNRPVAHRLYKKRQRGRPVKSKNEREKGMSISSFEQTWIPFGYQKMIEQSLVEMNPVLSP